MVGVAEAGAVLGSLKSAFDIAKGLQALQMDAKVKLATMELMEKIIAAQQDAFASQEAQAALLHRIRALETELAETKKWDAEKQNYELKNVYPGAFAYMLKPGMRGEEPAHWLCVNCYGNGHKSVLQSQGRDPKEQRTTVYGCPNCRTQIRVVYAVKPTYEEAEAEPDQLPA